MTIRESIKKDIDSLPDDVVYALKDYILFHKYRHLLDDDDTAYLSSIPGMNQSVREGVETPISECVPLTKVWPDV